MSEYQIITLPLGRLYTNCYLLICGESRLAAVIDPGADAQRILDAARQAEAEISMIINTHGHWDHVGANRELQELCGAPILIHREDAAALQDGSLSLAAHFGGDPDCGSADRLLEEGDEILLGQLRLQVLHTPGHTPGGICLLGAGFLFSGDTLFNLSMGRSDLVGGDEVALLRSLQEKLYPLDDDLLVYPGHGSSSRMGYEKAHNPFLRN
ncbi:MAG: MBL fold metallo-hydrolase [Bacillota bacterium]|nr:MBL fold metallo-hydrolase [Bacillota bacterium]